MTDNLVWVVDPEPTPALRDRVKASQDFTLRHPSEGGDFQASPLLRTRHGLCLWSEVFLRRSL